MEDIDYEELEKWRDLVIEDVRRIMVEHGMVVSAALFLLKINGKYVANSIALPIGNEHDIRSIMAGVCSAGNVAAYMVVGEAKITYANPFDEKDALVFIYEDRLVSRTTMYEAIKIDGMAVISDKPLEPPEGIRFSLVLGYLGGEEEQLKKQ